MGKLNIAHHKSYHPYRRDNIERVRRDEEEARLQESQKEGRMLLADSEARLELLRARASGSGNKKPNKRQQEKEEEKLIAQRTSEAVIKQGHINFFEDLEQQTSIAATALTIRGGKKPPAEETDKGVPLAPSEKDLKPWYSAKGKERTTDGDDDGKRTRDLNRKSFADPLTNINSKLAKSTDKLSKPPRRPQISHEQDKPPSERDSRLNRESSERQRALELIQRKKREMQGGATPNTVRSGGYIDMYNKADVEEAHRHRDRRDIRNRRW